MMLSAFLMAAIVGLLDPQVQKVSDPFEGRWYGTVRMTDGRSLDTVIDSERLGQDWVLRITQLADNRSVQPIVEFKIENDRVELAPIWMVSSSSGPARSRIPGPPTLEP